MKIGVPQPSKLGVTVLLLLCLAASVQAAEIVGWDLLENGLCEITLDRDGDGMADTSELHVVEWSGRAVLSDAALLDMASLDRVWLFIVDGDDGQFIYAVQPQALHASDDSRFTLNE